MDSAPFCIPVEIRFLQSSVIFPFLFVIYLDTSIVIMEVSLHLWNFEED